MRGLIELTRLNKPVGIFLVMWPALWSLWLAAEGIPDTELIIIFIAGAVVMRSAGCIINDVADRKVDGKVTRTHLRPLITGKVGVTAALVLFAGLIAIAALLVLQTNRLTIYLSLIAVVLAAIYPFMKRHTHLPQVFLGAAFAMAVPMAYSAVLNRLDPQIWLVFIGVVFWTVAYDTFYAMVDRNDDIKAGVKSTAILFGDADKAVTATLQILFIISMLLAGRRFELGPVYYAGLAVASLMLAYQQYLIRAREPKNCMKAFLANQWLGAVLFAGIAADLAF